MAYPYFGESQPYVPIADKATPEQGWQPTLSQDQVRERIELYKRTPSLLNEQSVDDLQKHAVQYNIPFYRGDFNIVDAFKEFGKGVLGGFTTFDPFDRPDNEYEAIARNLGHLVGFAPGIASGPLKMMGAVSLARGAQGLSNYSVPMFGANWLTKKAKKVVKPVLDTAIKGRADAVGTASKFLTASRVGQAKHVAEGAFHLGAASAISSWQQGTDAMIQSAFGGAVAGGVFRGIGNFVNTGDKGADTVVRTLAGSIFQGLPATQRGATTPEQIYEYLLGAYFGGKEMPWYRAKAMKGLAKIEEQSQKNPELAATKDPHLLKEWNSYEPEVQTELIKLAEKTYKNHDVNRGIAHMILKEADMLDKDTGLPTPEGFKMLDTLVKGQESVRLDKANVVLHHGVSGARKGSDTIWAVEGAKYDVPFVHYSFKRDNPNKRIPGLIRPLRESELAEANAKVRRADESLDRLRTKGAKDWTWDALRRQWFQVKHSGGTYIVGKLKKGATEVEGSNGWAAQMSIDARKKHVYVWDIASKKWHRYDYKLNQFRMLDKTPKLVKRFAGLGVRNANKITGANKAIKDIYAVTFGNKKAEKVEEAGAVSEKDINIISTESKKEIDKLTKEADKLVKEYNIHAKDASDTSLNKSARKTAEKERDKLFPEIQKIWEKIEEKKEFVKVEEVEKEADFTEDGNDLGMIPADVVEKKSVYFVDNYMKKLWNIPNSSPGIKLQERAKYATIVTKAIDKFGEKNKRVNTKEIIKEIEKEVEDLGLKIEFEGEAEGNLRKWLTIRNFGKPVRYLKVDDLGVSITPKGSVMTRAGNKKIVNEPKKLIEEVHENMQGLFGKKVTEEPSMVIWDTITHPGKDGYTDFSLTGYRNMADRAKIGEVKSYEKYKKEAYKKMFAKGYYPFGGVGTKDAIYFVKMHPMIENAKDNKQAQKQYSLFKRGLKMVLTPKENQLMEEGIELAKKRKFATESEQKIEEMIHSNLLYDMHLNGFRPDLESTTLSTGYRKALRNLFGKEGDFIKNAIGWNKRQQIWMTPAWKADPEYVADYLNKVKSNDLVQPDNKNPDLRLNYIIARDIPEILEQVVRTNKTKNSENPTSVDGMIILRDDLVDAFNLDKGESVGLGQNKSFIVSPDSKEGALLGKFMFHSAGEKATEMMKKKGLHMIMQESAVKQRGNRNRTDYRIVNGELVVDDVSKVYELPVKDIKYNYSVTNGKHMLDKQSLPKQVLMSMSLNTYEPFSEKLIQDVFESTIYDRFVGDKVYNKKLQEYLDNPQPQKLNEIVDNIDKIGIDNLLHAIKKGHTNFTDVAYGRLMKFNKEALRDMVARGEMTEEQRNDAENSLNEFTTGTDRIIQEGINWKIQEQSQGRDGDIAPLFLHTYVRPFRTQVMRNFIIESLTKPKMENSAVARMRGYDKFFRVDKKFNELETRDDIFYLDDGFKELRINSHLGPKYNTLGKLWKAYTTKGNELYKSKDAREVLRAATVRVPMDSPSGLQVLNFKGFTGRKGHGILMHARAMEAEGGADLDGDESHIFFGGYKNGEGKGFKKEWKDAFEANKPEFNQNSEGDLDPNGNFRYNFKNSEIRKDLTIQDSKRMTGMDVSERDSYVYKYIPQVRTTISERASEGRKQLGLVANMIPQFKAYHAALTNKGFEDIADGEIRITPKTNLDRARKTQASMVAFAADPMDEAGLKSAEYWSSTLYNQYFNVQKKNIKGKLEDVVGRAKIEKLMKDLRYKGMLGDLTRMNQGMYSRNWGANRAFNMHEITELTKSVNYKNKFGEEINRNTMLPKIANLANTIDFTDSVYKRINVPALGEMYKQHARIVKRIPYLADFLGRSSITVKDNAYIRNVVNKFLWNQRELNKNALKYKNFIDSIQGTIFSYKLKANELKDNTNENIIRRKAILEKIRAQSEDFLVNDITDMVSVRLINKAIKDGKIDKNKVKMIHRFADKMKKESYLMARNRINLMKKFYKGQELEAEARELYEDFYQLAAEAEGVKGLKKRKFKQIEKPVEDASSLKDQIKIDAEIKDYKKTLNKKEAKLLDMLMLGSLRRGKLRRLNELDKKWGKKLKKDPLLEDLYHFLKYESAKTQTSKLGFNSESIDGSSVRDFVGEYSKIMNKSWKKAPDTGFEKQIENAKEPLKETIFEAEIDKKVEGTEISEIYSGFEGLEKADLSKLSKEQRALATEIATHLKFYGTKASSDLNALVRGMFGKDLNAMNFVDFQDFNAQLNELRRGTLWQRLFKEKTPDLRKRYSIMMPETIGREMMKDNIMFLKTKGQFIKKDGTVSEGEIIEKPTNVIEAAQNILSRMADQGVQEGERLIGTLREKLGFLDGISDGELLRRVAVSKMETAEIKRILNSTTIPDALKGVQVDEYRRKYNEAAKEADYKNKADKTYIVTDQTGERIKLTGKQIVEKTEQVYNEHFGKMYETIEGKPGALSNYIKGFYDKAKEEPIIDVKAFVRDVTKMFNEGKGIPLDYGLTNLRHISRSMMITEAAKRGNTKLVHKLMKIKINPVGRIREGYWPHMFFSKSKSLESLKRAHEYIKNLPEEIMTKDEKVGQLTKLLLKGKTLTGDWMTGTENWDLFDKAVENVKSKDGKDPLSAFDSANQMTGSMNSRISHVGGWSIDAAAAETYTRNQINTYYKQFSQIMSRDLLSKFTDVGLKNKWHKENISSFVIDGKSYKSNLLSRWQNWLKMYISESMGSPSIIPDYVLEDPAMKIKGTPYHWFADSAVKSKVNKIAKKLGIRGKNALVLKHDLERIDYNDLRRWSQLEAKFELASLLAHPKSMVQNIFGGSLHTIQATGLEYLRKARSIKELQKILPGVKSLKDVDEFVVKHGVLPEFIVAELGLSREAQTTNVQNFLKAVTRKISNTGEMSKETLSEINRRYNVSENIINKAAKFMSVPERALRRDAFMAHYIKAWERFGGAIKNPDHPFLIEQAKKGVKATQFLYSAPFRPGFSRTALGKVMTRFQTWSWNAVKFRNDIIREARVRGFRQGTAEFDKFKRTMQADLMVLALANVFAYSIFDQTLPAPYNWLQDTSEWLFGDENERNRAFFGNWPTPLAPLQVVTPPIMRVPVAGLRAFLDDDYSRLSDYYVYTMMPFGRIVRDVSPFAKGNLIENPHRLVEKMTGFPLGDVSRLKRDLKKQSPYYPRSFEDE